MHKRTDWKWTPICSLHQSLSRSCAKQLKEAITRRITANHASSHHNGKGGLFVLSQKASLHSVDRAEPVIALRFSFLSYFLIHPSSSSLAELGATSARVVTSRMAPALNGVLDLPAPIIGLECGTQYSKKGVGRIERNEVVTLRSSHTNHE
jgi:hypothetical protein